MIMKANKQIGFININEESIDKILKDGDVVFERGFLRERTTTTLPITFGGVGKDLKDYRVYGNTYQELYGENLFDKDTTNKLDAYYEYSEDTIHSSTSNRVLYIPCKASTTYLFIKGVSSLPNHVFQVATTNVLPAINETVHNFINYSNTMFTYATDASSQYIVFRIRKGDDTEEFLSKIQIYEGSNTKITNCGIKTPNLFDKKTATYKDGYLKNDNGVEQTTTTSGYLTSYVPVEPQTKYTIQGALKNFEESSHLYRLYFYDINKNWISRTSGINQNPPYTFTTPNNCYYIQFQYRLDSYDENTIQIEKGTTATSYEPYGYKIPINVRNDNLLNTLNIPETTAGAVTYKSENGLITLNGASSSRNIELKTGLNEPLNGQYTVIFKKISGNIINNSYEVRHRFALGNEENPNAGSSDGRLFSDTFSSATDVVVVTGTINDVLDKISIYINPNCTFNNYTFQLYLVKGTYTTSNLPKFQPYYNETTNIYLDEPLRKIEEYSDYIDFINGKVVRNIKEVVLNGSETWKQSSARNVVHNIMLEDMLPPKTNSTNYINGISDKFINDTNYNQITGSNYNRYFNRMSATSDKYLSFSYETTTTINDWKTWLQSNNVTADYVLATPTEESITLPNIPTIDGNNTLNIETEITPSQVYIKYKSNT